jgi:hypothetical protein
VDLKVGDYLILNIVAGKRALAKCSAIAKDGSRYKAVVETNSDKPEPAIEFKLKEVVANLGHSPNAGSVYGVKVEPVREVIELPFWDAVQVHHVLDDAKRKTLKKAMTEVATKFKAQKVPALPIQTEIRTQQGSMAGYYRFRPKADNDILCVKLDDDMSDLAYRFSHEYAHGIWFRNFTPQMKMAWIDLFHTAVEITEYSNKDLLELLEDLKTAGDLRTFCKDNVDDMKVIRAIFRHIKTTHQMEKAHFEMALMLGNDIDQYWPTAMELGEKQTLLTTYAMKSPEELWAETFSLKFIGKKLPSKIDALLDRCMRRLVK